MEIALAILIPVCATALIIAKWIIRPKADPVQLRLLEMQLLKWAADTYTSDRDNKVRSILAYFRKHYPEADQP